MTAKIMLAAAVSSLSLALAGPALAETAACKTPAPDAANGLFQKWAAALPGHNPIWCSISTRPATASSRMTPRRR